MRRHCLPQKTFFLFSVLGIVSGCAPIPPRPLYLKPATPIVTQPVVMPTQPDRSAYRLAYGNNPALRDAYQRYLRTGKAPTLEMAGFKVFAYGATQPVIASSPFELTVISLETGEKVTNVSTGDPLRWSYSLAYSGQGKNRQAQVMIKPSQTQISTDFVITTDKRLYTLKLVSQTGTAVKDVRFWYPEEIQAFWDQYNVTQGEAAQSPQTIAALPISVDQLHFNYTITCDSRWHCPNWKPLRAFDDGTHTYIQFPATMVSRDMPALFVITQHQQALVNYRSKPPYFVVDKLFDEARLVIGVGRAQTFVTIARTPT